jgi:hypothetical protein
VVAAGGGQRGHQQRPLHVLQDAVVEARRRQVAAASRCCSNSVRLQRHLHLAGSTARVPARDPILKVM